MTKADIKMTKAEIRMSRRIDELIADKVMDITLYPSGLIAIPPSLNCMRVNEIPKYSTNIADAWLVVEKLRELRFQIVSNSNDVMCWFGNYCGGWTEKAPMAICLAALRAKNLEIPDGDQDDA